MALLTPPGITGQRGGSWHGLRHTTTTTKDLNKMKPYNAFDTETEMWCWPRRGLTVVCAKYEPCFSSDRHTFSSFVVCPFVCLFFCLPVACLFLADVSVKVLDQTNARHVKVHITAHIHPLIRGYTLEFNGFCVDSSFRSPSSRKATSVLFS